MHLLLIALILLVLALLLLFSSNKDKVAPKVSPTQADIIIVGAGTAGCVLAKRLNQAYPHKQIVILERGADHSDDPAVYNVANANQAASNEPYSERITLKQDLEITQGTMYGGSSSHNYAQAVHGSAHFYNTKWRVLNMNYTDYLPYIKQIEKYTGETQDFKLRGNSGELSIIQLKDKINIWPRVVPALKEAFSNTGEGLSTLIRALNTALNLGPLGAASDFTKPFNQAVSKTQNVPIVEDYNTNVTHCTVAYQQLFVNYATGLRSSPNVTYLRQTNNNVTVIPQAYVNKINSDSVSWSHNRKLKLNSNGRIIVSAGAIYTPQLLLRSGFTQVGSNLKNHYGFSVIAAVPKNTLKKFSIGPMAFLPQDAESKTRDWQLVVGGDLFIDPKLISNPDSNLDYITFILWLLNPTAEGQVKENSVEYNFFTKPDLQACLDGMKYVYKLIHILQEDLPDLKMVYPPPEITAENSDTVLTKYIQQSISVTSHWCHTCALGQHVNPDNFSLYQQSNVHIVDASVFPDIPDGNTEFPVCLMAEVAADRIIQSFQK